MKALKVIIPLVVLVLVGWYLLYTGKIKLPKEIMESEVIQTIIPAPTPTPTLPPPQDIDKELDQTDQDLENTNPNGYTDLEIDLSF